uniref:Uncharacterized protein n=1 Tax=Arundo donax TaxID=35708 RepID=A0A0A9HE27_ARUDO
MDFLRIIKNLRRSLMVVSISIIIFWLSWNSFRILYIFSK